MIQLCNDIIFHMFEYLEPTNVVNIATYNNYLKSKNYSTIIKKNISYNYHAYISFDMYKVLALPFRELLDTHMFTTVICNYPKRSKIYYPQITQNLLKSSLDKFKRKKCIYYDDLTSIWVCTPKSPYSFFFNVISVFDKNGNQLLKNSTIDGLLSGEKEYDLFQIKTELYDWCLQDRVYLPLDFGPDKINNEFYWLYDNFIYSFNIKTHQICVIFTVPPHIVIDNFAVDRVKQIIAIRGWVINVNHTTDTINRENDSKNWFIFDWYPSDNSSKTQYSTEPIHTIDRQDSKNILQFVHSTDKFIFKFYQSENN